MASLEEQYAAELGPVEETFHTTASGKFFIVFFLVMVFAIGFAGLFAWFIDKDLLRDPQSSATLRTVCGIGGGIILLVVAPLVCWLFLSGWNDCLIIFQKGFVAKSGKSIIKRTGSDFTTFDLHHWGEYTTLTLHFAGQEDYAQLNKMFGLPALYKLIWKCKELQESPYKNHWRDAVVQGKLLYFLTLKVDNVGLHYDRKTVKWRDFRGLDIRKRFLGYEMVIDGGIDGIWLPLHPPAIDGALLHLCNALKPTHQKPLKKDNSY